MLGHYFSAAVRNFRRAPFSTSINVLALAFGLICLVIAYGVSAYWEQSERHFANSDRTYVVTTSRGSSGMLFPETSAALAQYLKLDFPELEAVARLRPRDTDDMGDLVVSARDEKTRLSSAYADPEFLHIFNLPFVAGDAKDALSEPNSVVLTEAAAIRLFGSHNVLGRRLLLDNFIEVTVQGVIGSLPEPSHMGNTAAAAITFDLLATADVHDRLLERAGEMPGNSNAPQLWYQRDYITYILLPENGALTAAALSERLQHFAAQHVPAAVANTGLRFGVAPVRDLTVQRLNGILFLGAAVGVSITTLFLLLGGLVLVIACLNYANLATALATNRTKEVGLRRVVGANRGQIALQYMFEAALLTAAALVVALGLVALVVPVLKAAAGIDLGLALFSRIAFWGFLAMLLVVVSVVAGCYPALILSRVRPVEALRAGRTRTGMGSAATLLVGIQFAAASFLLIVVIVMYAQNNELRRKALGTGADRLLVITNLSEVTKVDPKILHDELSRLPQVRAVAGYRELPWSLVTNVLPFARSPDEVEAHGINAYFDRVDHDFFATLEMRTLAGRVFDRRRGDDAPLSATALRQKPARPLNAVVDRAFATELGFARPQDAVNQIIHTPMLAAQPVRIIGVVENQPLHLVGMGATSHLYFLVDSPRFQIVRISGTQVPGALQSITQVWDRLSPHVPLQLSFMDTLFDQSYQLFERINQVFVGLAFFAFAISMMGLFGMAVHMANRRVHEIGVRKTLGASTRRILVTLLRDFSKPVVMANLVAWPLAFFFAKVYLSVFIQRIPLSPIPFLLSLAITVLIAWVALSFQTIRAARLKPAMVLRYE